MRLAVFTDSYTPQINGVVTQIINITAEFLKRGHKVMVIAPSQDSKFRHAKGDNGGFEEIFLSSIALPTYKDYRITHFFSPGVFHEVERFRPDVVHVHTPFSVGWLGVNCAKRLKVPVVGTYHTLIPEFLTYLPIPVLKDTALAKKLAWGYTNLFYNSCSLVTTPTGFMRDELEANGVKKGVVVLPNAIDFSKFNKHAKKSYGVKKPRLIYFGRIGFEKNLEVLIHALKHLLWKDWVLSLTITGSGPAEAYLKAIVAEEKLDRHVAFHEALKDDALARHVSKHDIFVTASTIETQGLTVLEAMAAGLPCVGADYLGIKDSIKEGKNGYLFKPYDFKELASKVEKLLSSAALRKRLGRNAISTARKYSVENMADRAEEIYRKLTGK